MNMDLDTIKKGLLEEIDAHANEIAQGRYNWFQVKIFLNRNAISSTFQCEEKERMIRRASYVQEVYVNGPRARG